MLKIENKLGFVKSSPFDFETFDVWLNKIEDSRPCEKQLKSVIKECKEFYGVEFVKFFDEDQLNNLHEMYLDIALMELTNLD